jgi:Protein of unknown function (DUF3006)
MPPRAHYWRIDGIDEGVARVEEDGERMLSIPRHLLPSGVKEGQVLRVTRDPAGKSSVALTITIDDAATSTELARSREQTAATQARSRKRDPGGNVSL